MGTQFINDACGEGASWLRFSHWLCSSSSKSLTWVDVFGIPSDNVSIRVLFLLFLLHNRELDKLVVNRKTLPRIFHVLELSLSGSQSS